MTGHLNELNGQANLRTGFASTYAKAHFLGKPSELAVWLGCCILDFGRWMGYKLNLCDEFYPWANRSVIQLRTEAFVSRYVDKDCRLKTFPEESKRQKSIDEIFNAAIEQAEHLEGSAEQKADEFQRGMGECATEIQRICWQRNAFASAKAITDSSEIEDIHFAIEGQTNQMLEGLIGEGDVFTVSSQHAKNCLLDVVNRQESYRSSIELLNEFISRNWLDPIDGATAYDQLSEKLIADLNRIEDWDQYDKFMQKLDTFVHLTNQTEWQRIANAGLNEAHLQCVQGMVDASIEALKLDVDFEDRIGLLKDAAEKINARDPRLWETICTEKKDQIREALFQAIVATSQKIPDRFDELELGAKKEALQEIQRDMLEKLNSAECVLLMPREISKEIFESIKEDIQDHFKTTWDNVFLYELFKTKSEEQSQRNEIEEYAIKQGRILKLGHEIEKETSRKNQLAQAMQEADQKVQSLTAERDALL